MTLEELKKELKKNSRPNAMEGMARYGIDISKAYGVSIPELRKLAKQIGKRNKTLHKIAFILAKEIEKINSKSAKWIAKDAIRELTDLKTVSRLK